MKLPLPSNPVKSHLIQVALRLPVVFLWWFAFAVWLTVPLRRLLNALMPELYPNAITAIEQDGFALDVVTRFVPPSTPGISIPEGKIGTMVIQINPLICGNPDRHLALILSAVYRRSGAESCRQVLKAGFNRHRHSVKGQ